MMTLQPIIGLEIHLQLNTKSKVFCGCSAATWKADPNTHTCPVCLGLPGALPVINRQAVEDAILMGLALNCEINRETYFERKNYFYPDLPKGYQISQKRAPLSRNGHLQINGEKIGIWEVHLEEDTAKSLHQALVKSPGLNKGEGITLLDFNKSGVPLVEIVSAPCIHSIETLDAYAKEVREIARTLDISEGDMEKGQMRFEANISVRQLDSGEIPPGKAGEEKSQAFKKFPKPGFGESPAEKSAGQIPDYRVEIKNLNSFKALRDSVSYEIERQRGPIERGEKPTQETRGWNPDSGKTFVQREKEYAHDYRYFPEPDLPPIQLDSGTVRQLGSKIPELPSQKRARLEKLGLTKEQAEIISGDPKREKYFSEIIKAGISEADVKELVNLVINQPEMMDKKPKEVLGELKREAEEIISSEGELSKIAQKVIAENPQPVSDYKSGKGEALQFLIGQVMKETRGKADPQVAAKCLRNSLK